MIPENKILCTIFLFWPRPHKIQMQFFAVSCNFSKKSHEFGLAH